MSNPSFENIDRWLFELTEGNLSPEQEAQLEAFLMQHPELDLERDVWDLAHVNVSHNGYQNKKQLEKRRRILPYIIGTSAACAGIICFILFSNISNNDKLLLRSERSIFKTHSSNGHVNEKTSPLGVHNNKSLANANADGNAAEKNKMNVALNANTNVSTHSSAVLQKNKLSNFNSASNEALFGIRDEASTDSKQPQLALNALDLSLNYKHIGLKRSKANPSVVQEEKNKSFDLSFGNLGIKSKAKRFVKNIDNAMKNPVALINLKDNWYQVPGLTPTDVNFASVGSILSTRIQTSTRLQWFGNDNQQFSNQIAVDAYAHELKGGIGLQMNHNFYGNGGIQNYNAALIYSPKIPLSANFVLEPSVRFKMGTKQLNPENLGNISQVEFDRFNAIDYYTSGSNPIGRTLWYRDVGAGLMLNTKWFYASFQADNLMKHFDNIYSAEIENPRKAPYHYMASFGGEYMSKKRTMSLSPYLVYQHFGDLEELWGGVNFRYKWIRLGAAVSSNLEPSASLGLRFNHFTLMYIADYTQSAILNKSSLSHQLTLRFNTKPCRIGQRIIAK
jgi:type IX secretion system PorP/SprF family membrane protein